MYPSLDSPFPAASRVKTVPQNQFLTPFAASFVEKSNFDSLSHRFDSFLPSNLRFHHQAAMFVDPLTLSALRLLLPLFQACEKVYTTWRLAQKFGNDLYKLECMLDAQYARLAQIGSRRRDQLADPPDPNDDFHHATSAIHHMLLCVNGNFTEIESLIQGATRRRVKLQKPRPESHGTLPASQPEGPSRSQDAVAETLPTAPAASGSPRPTLSSSMIPSTGLAPSTSLSPSTSLTPSLSPAPSSSSAVSTVTTLATTVTPSPEDSTSKKPTSERDELCEQSSSRKGKRTWAQRLRHVSFLGKRQPHVPRPEASATQHVLSRLILETEVSTAQRGSTPVQDQATTVPAEYDRRAGYGKKLEWALGDKQKLEGYITELTQFIDALDHLTRERTGRGVVVHSSDDGSKQADLLLRTAVGKTQSALDRLHRSLKSMNGKNYRFALQLTDDYELLGRSFANVHDYLCPDGTSFFYFALQRHPLRLRGPDDPVSEPSDASESSLFVAESSMDSSKSMRRLHRDDHALELEASRNASGTPATKTFERWGGVFPPTVKPDDDMDVHWLFRDRVHRWTCQLTLAEAFRTSTLGSRMTINQRLRLSVVVANAYLYLARVKAMCEPITLDTLRYYALDGKQKAMDQFDPLLSLPYIDFGYGQAQDILIGDAQELTSLNPVVDLGIALLQIGRCLSHDYDSRVDCSMSQARTWAQSSLKYLDYALPVDFTEIVNDCIEHEQRSIPGQYEKNLEAENDFLLDKVRRLLDLQSRFGSTSRSGAMVPVTRE